MLAMARLGTLRVNGKRIAEARERNGGMTQYQLARAINTSEKNISRWESGQNQPRVSSIIAIAQATGHDLDFFLTGSAEADDDEEAAMAAALLAEAKKAAVEAATIAARQAVREELALLLVSRRRA